MRINKYMTAALLLLASVAVPMSAMADDVLKVVIQVSTGDPLAQKIALNNAVNLQKDIGMDNIEIEIVAYGPGLSIMTPKSKESSRIPSLAQQNITFSACNNTIKKVTKKTGKKPTLVEGVSTVPSGAMRIVQLQQQGYSYLRP